MKIKKDDTVQVIAGKDKGRTGKILKVDPLAQRVLVEGVGLAKKHRKAARRGQEKGIVEKPTMIDASNVMLIDPTAKVPTRIGYEGVGKDKKRIAKKSGKIID